MENLDPQAFNLAKAIRKTETGGSKDPYNQKGASGEFGAYQFMPATYKTLAKQHLGDENAAPTIENQNKIAYSEIKRLKDAGKTPAEIASYWNSGKTEAYKQGKVGTNKLGVKYDVPGYVSKVSEAYRELSQTPQAPQSSQVPSQEKSKSSVLFPSNPNDTGLQAGLKALGNTPQSAFNFAKGVANSANPITTVQNIGKIGSEFGDLAKQRGTAGAIGDVLKGLLPAAYETLVPKGIRQVISGDFSGASKSFTEDPFGQAAPVVLAAVGGAKALDNIATKNAIKNYVKQPMTATKSGYIPEPITKYSNAVDKSISAISKVATRPLGAVLKAPAELASKVTRSIASNLVGLDPQSISRIIADPKQYSKMAQEQATRGNLANDFGRSIDKVEESLQETGKAYEPIRKNTTPVTIPPQFVDNVFQQFGLKVNKGKVIADTNSITRNTGDIRALQNFYDNWGKKKTLTPSEYLNMRKDIAGIAKFGKEIGTNIDAQKVGTKLYDEGNKIIRPKIKGLEELDAQYSPQKQQFNQIKKDFLQKGVDGEYSFKEGAINKIANAANKGKDALLARMEEVHPGVTKKIQILQTVEDIQKAYGNKVGNYAKGVLTGGSVLTGNIPAIIATIIANPSIAVPLLRSYGYTAAKIGPIIQALKTVAGDVGTSKLSAIGSIGAIREKHLNK